MGNIKRANSTNNTSSSIKITLLGNPLSTNSVYKHARGMSYMTRKGRELKDSYIEQAVSQFGTRKLLDTKLTIAVGVYLGDKRRRDWDNYHKLSMDALNGTVWEDDELIFASYVYKLMDTENPRIELYIREYDESRDGFKEP